MAADESDLVSRLLKQSILTLCREAMTYRCRLEVDGIVCLTVDERAQCVVKIHEVFDRRCIADDVRQTERDAHVSTASTSAFINENGKNESADTKLLDMGKRSLELTEHFERSFDLKRTRNEPEGTVADRNSLSVGHHMPTINNVAIDLSVVKQEPSDFTTGSNAEVKDGESAIFSNLPAKDHGKMGPESVTLSSATNIACKKCDAVIDSVGKFEEHNMSVHSHFTCLICLATFTSRNNMKRHVRLHTGIKPYSCHKCPESFSRNDDFKRHLLKHTFQKPFRCAVCKTGYSDRACIRGHMIKEHGASVYNICPQCGETFIDSQKFQEHKERHPELQDFRCSVCSFTGSSALMYHKHMLTHGSSKEYSCKHCGVTFTDPFAYTGHLKQHKGDDSMRMYVCCFCDTTLATFEQFQRHEHTHIHPKQHVCQECHKVFRYPSNLREHMVTHLSKADLLGTTSHNDGNEVHEPSTDSREYSLVENASSDEGKMEIEENNNHMDNDSVCCEQSDSEVSAGDNVSGSSEYWCTECNHGFGTEHELQEHIIEKHEEGERYSNNIADIRDFKRDLGLKLTQANSPEASTTSLQISVLNNPSKHIMYHNVQRPILDTTPSSHMKQESGSNDEDTRVDSNTEAKKTLLVAKMAGSKQINIHKTRVYDEETVVGQPSIEVKKHILLNPRTAVDTVTDRYAQRERNRTKFPLGQQNKRAEYASMGLPTTVQEWNEMNDDTHKDDLFGSISRQERAKSLPPSSVYMQYGRSISGAVNALKMKIQHRQHESDEDIAPKTEDFTSDPAYNGSPSDSRNSGMPSNESHSDIPSTTGVESSASPHATPSRTTTINLKIRNPGFERVVTPQVLFKTKAPFTCELCDETFDIFESFHDHGAKVHRRYICSYCGKVFTSRPNRERHIRYHTGDRPYKCELCSMTFLRGDDLKYHRTTKHADVKPFMCAACQTSFSLPKELEKHLKVHPDHKL